MTREHLVACPTLVGRAQHLSRCRQLVHAAQSGRGQIALIAGEAGVGKSRLAAEVRAYAATQGFLILQGHCYQPDLVNPFAPLLDLVRSQFASHPTSLAAPATAAIVRELCPLAAGPGCHRKPTIGPNSGSTSRASSRQAGRSSGEATVTMCMEAPARSEAPSGTAGMVA
jgi:hypothetical protein